MFSLENKDEMDADQMPQMECPNPQPHEEFTKNERAFEVKRALEKLKPEYRSVIELYYMQGLSYREIGLTIECNENTVGTLIHRAKNELEKVLDID